MVKLIASLKKHTTRALAISAALTSVYAAFAQLPPSQTLSPQDMQSARAEIVRLERLAQTAPDRCAGVSEIARTWAFAGQYPETIAALRNVVALNAGFDIARDKVFAKLKGVPQFETLVQQAREATPPIRTSQPAFKIPEGDLVPENLAYDPATREFFFGSTTKNKIVRCTSAGSCKPFATGLGTVLGLKVDPVTKTLWATSNSSNESGLFHYDLASGKLIRKFTLTGAHIFNDLVVTEAGDVFVTDTRAGAVYRLRNTIGDLEVLPGAEKLPAANGIALSPDQTRLYLASFGDGISLVDPASGKTRPIARPPNICLAYIDGLYAYRRSLIAIQNGPMTPRVVRLHLDNSRDRIVRLEVLERRNPIFDGVTTGVLTGRDFYFMANTQDDKPAGAKFDPLTVLRIALKPDTE
jgi:sugar lactone lactonase YvrE